MKGYSGNSRYRLKTKVVHGVRTGEHNNPHVMKAARRAHGGMCEGESATRNLGRSGRLKATRKGKADGGGLDWQAGGRALAGLGGLGMPGGGSAQPASAGAAQDDALSATQKAGRQLMSMNALGMRRHGGAVRDSTAGAAGAVAARGATGAAMRTAAAPSLPDPDLTLAADLGAGLGPMAVRNDRLLTLAPPPEAAPFKHGGVAKQGGGEISDNLGDEALDLHALEHRLLAAREKGDVDDGDREERKDGGRSGKWIQGAIKHPGALRKSLHVPEGEPIPAAKLEKATHSDNPKLARRARLAETLKGFHK